MNKKAKNNKFEKEKRDKPISLYPLKPEEALSAFMKADPKKYKEWKEKEK
jgi:hypothetical protein